MIVTEPTDGKVFSGEKGELWIRALFSGKAAHGSTPELGISALLPAASFCTRIAATAEFKEIKDLGRTSLNIGKLVGGWQVNIVPERTEVELDFRVISEKDKQWATGLVSNLGEEEARKAGAGFEFEVFSYHPPIFTNRDNRYVKEFLKAASIVTGEEVATEVSPYCTDAATIIPQVHIPFVIYGPGTIALAHQPDEYLELSSLERSLAVLLNFLERVLEP